MGEIVYIGNELDLFEQATVWKNYYGRFLKPYLKGNVLEVGAGIGGTTQQLCSGSQENWVCLEPDPELCSKLEKKIIDGDLPACCRALKGTIADLPATERFNAIIYIDVIEHIEKDAEELQRAASLLADGGYLIVLVPAHQFLYNEFDKAIGHFRRYNKKMLRAAAPEEMLLQKMRYFDVLGLIASLANKFFLKQEYPTYRQVGFWDKCLVRLSKPLDILINYQTGKTLTGIWQKKE